MFSDGICFTKSPESNPTALDTLAWRKCGDASVDGSVKRGYRYPSKFQSVHLKCLQTETRAWLERKTGGPVPERPLAELAFRNTIRSSELWLLIYVQSWVSLK